MRLRAAAAALTLLAGCAEVSADPTPTSNETPVTVVAPEPEPTIVVAPAVVVAPVDPERCFDGSPFVKTPDGFICASRYHPLVPMSIPEMVAAVGLPAIFTTTIIPRESRWNPAVVNRYGCVGLTQHCAKRSLYESHGYAWPTDAANAWVHLLMTKILYDEQGLKPWQCSRCSMPRRSRHR